MKKIFSILCILTIILALGCAEQIQEPEETPTETEEVTTEPEEIVEIIEEEPVPTELFSEVRCVSVDEDSRYNKTNGRIIGVLTNTIDTMINIEKDVPLFVNGNLNRELGCDVEELEPGESTYCETLNGRFPIRTGKNRLTTEVDGAKYDDIVTC